MNNSYTPPIIITESQAKYAKEILTAKFGQIIGWTVRPHWYGPITMYEITGQLSS